MNDEDKLLQTWCIEQEIDFELAKKLKDKIFPMLEKAHSQLIPTFTRAFMEQNRGTKIRVENTVPLINLLSKKLNPKNFKIEENWAITLHLEYLPLVEGLFSTQINFLIFLLVNNGFKLYSPIKRANVKTMRDIERVPLHSRLRFLTKNGFDELISKKVNVDLRNSVAHLFYEVEGDCLKIPNQTVTHEIYRENYVNLWQISQAMHHVNLLFYKRFESAKLPFTIEVITLKCDCGYENLIPNIKFPNDFDLLKCTNCGKKISIGDK